MISNSLEPEKCPVPSSVAFSDLSQHHWRHQCWHQLLSSSVPHTIELPCYSASRADQHGCQVHLQGKGFRALELSLGLYCWRLAKGRAMQEWRYVQCLCCCDRTMTTFCRDHSAFLNLALTIEVSSVFVTKQPSTCRPDDVGKFGHDSLFNELRFNLSASAVRGPPSGCIRIRMSSQEHP